MDQNPLVNELIDAGSRFLDEFEKSYPIGAAFWLKDRDESRWHLHVASKKINDANTREAYGEVYQAITRMKDVQFDPFYVRLRKIDDPIVRFAIDFPRPFPARLATVFNVPTFEGVEVEGMYLYPPVKPAAA